MAVQKKIDLNKPVSSSGAPKLEVVALEPQYAEASLLLHGDAYRQYQTIFTKRVLWDRYVLSLGVASLAAYTYYALMDYIDVSESVAEFCKLVLRSSELRATLLMNFAVLAGFIAVVGLCSFMISDEFRVICDSLIKKEYSDYVYGFDLVKYSKLELNAKNFKEKKLLANGANSQVVLFKEEPIAVLTLKTVPESSNDATLVVKITGIGIRKVFGPLNFEQVLLDWAVRRSNDLLKENLAARKIKQSSGCKVTVLIDSYSFNHKFNKLLEANKFSKVSSSINYNPTGNNTGLWNGLVNKAFGSTRDTYALHIVKK